MDNISLSALLKDVRKFEKNFVNNEQNVKVAVLGSCSTQYFVKFLRYFLFKNNIKTSIYEGEYNSINMEVFDKKSSLYEFNPDYVILLPYVSDIKNYPPLLSDSTVIEEYINSELEYYKNVWKNLSDIRNVKVLQCNFVIPPIRITGNLEYQLPSSKFSFVSAINSRLLVEKSSNVTFIDAESLSSNLGKFNWFDYSAYFLNKAPAKLEYMPEFVNLFVKQILALQGNVKKCLVLDLDNTLWGGVVGDDGYNGIQLDPNNAIGESYRFFQSYCLELKKRGVILAVCSKNELDLAKEPFLKNENMLIKLDDISCFIANWDNKADNLKMIAEQLNIGLDSLVFFDDNPAEREIVRKFAPEVTVIDVPEDPALYVLQMEKESPFEWCQITNEDLSRSSSYIENIKRKNLLESFIDYDDYLKALEMKGTASLITESEITRFSQLINKSNQFNLRTIRYSEGDIKTFIKDNDVRCICAKLSDRYSNYGIISCVILKKNSDHCFIDTWVMSCRVLKRGVERMMFEKIIHEAKKMGCNILTSEYLQTKKNKMVCKFYETLNFDLVSEESDEYDCIRKKYIYKINDYINQNVRFYIKEK